MPTLTLTLLLLALTVIRRLRCSGVPLAAVYNQAGEPLGVVSTEDLVRHMLLRP